MRGHLNRRRAIAAVTAAVIGSTPAAVTAGGVPPVRAVTRGPKHHWFGYYDKREFDPSGRYLLGMEVGFEGRSPVADDAVTVGMVDLKDGDRWIELGESRAWCWQQGCMLQWLPGSKTEVIWNDRDGDRFVSRVLDVVTRAGRSLPAPIYALSPDATWAVSADFRRLHDTRPGYGYAGIPDPARDVAAPDDSGVWRVDLKTGRTDLLFSVRQVAALPYLKPGEGDGATHWLNHLLVAPDGSRFAFLHRWRRPGQGQGFMTRLLTADVTGRDLRVVDPYGKTSHYVWRDPDTLLAWAYHPSHGEKFYLYEERSGRATVVAPTVMTENGHCTYLAGGRFILNDTYPDRGREQHPYLFDTRSGDRDPLGDYLSPARYSGEFRCDTHPRSSDDGRLVAFDSPHGGSGRQIYLANVSGIVG